MDARRQAVGTCRRAGAVLAAAVLSAALAAGLLPCPALAYYDRGAVGVELASTSIDVSAGETVEVSVTLDPATDEQTEGCGMPKCPQLCADGCLDENGQCTCAGTEYATYTATAVATTSDASVATAVYSAGTLSVTGVAAGTATITLTASLRQFTDGQATLAVTVTGQASDDTASAGSADVELPDEADITQQDRAATDVKTVMGRTIRYARITGSLDVAGTLAELAGVDGDVTLWSGDTYYYPAYSLTFTGTDYGEDDVFDFDAELAVSTSAGGLALEALEGLDGTVIVAFAHDGTLPASACVYALATSVFASDDSVALYSYDEDADAFVAEEAEATLVGDYVAFDATEGKTYVVSTHDLTDEAALAAAGGTADESAPVPPFAYALVAILVLAAALLVLVAVLVRRRACQPSVRAADAPTPEAASGETDGGSVDETAGPSGREGA